MTGWKPRGDQRFSKERQQAILRRDGMSERSPEHGIRRTGVLFLDLEWLDILTFSTLRGRETRHPPPSTSGEKTSGLMSSLFRCCNIVVLLDLGTLCCLTIVTPLIVYPLSLGGFSIEPVTRIKLIIIN